MYAANYGCEHDHGHSPSKLASKTELGDVPRDLT